MIFFPLPGSDVTISKSSPVISPSFVFNTSAAYFSVSDALSEIKITASFSPPIKVLSLSAAEPNNDNTPVNIKRERTRHTIFFMYIPPKHKKGKRISITLDYITIVE